MEEAAEAARAVGMAEVAKGEAREEEKEVEAKVAVKEGEGGVEEATEAE